jgi:hypothetical protein
LLAKCASYRYSAGILRGCKEPMGSMPAIMPSPGGGMTMEKVKAMGEVYGDDVLLLIGGAGRKLNSVDPPKRLVSQTLTLEYINPGFEICLF